MLGWKKPQAVCAEHSYLSSPAVALLCQSSSWDFLDDNFTMDLAGSLQGPGLEGGLEPRSKVGSQDLVWQVNVCSWACRVENEGARRELCTERGLAAGEPRGFFPSLPA